MTPDRFRECLTLLHWSQRDLAQMLYCDDRQVWRWAQGCEPIPESIARWLESLAGDARNPRLNELATTIAKENDR